jgi:hypothetical protein
LTRLEERPLQEIARRTQGKYLAAGAHAVPLGAWLRGLMDARGTRRAGELTTEPALTLQQPRYVWFFGAALGCFAVSLSIGGLSFRRKPRPRTEVDGPKEQP